MKSDIHFTTCHHSSVKCRPRTNDYKLDGFNITPWTTHDKLMIASKSLKSLSNFVEQQISIIDDGSDYGPAIDWLNIINEIPKYKVLRYEHRGSSAGLNDYIKTLDSSIDMIGHFEDDHIYFNPENIDWKTICFKYLTTHRDIGVITFRSGLPTDPNFPDYKGAWGPIDFREGPVCPAFIFRCMGNAHHIMLRETYERFFPLQGNAGSCEAYMNNKLQSLGLLNAELQIPVYAFHSHCWKRDLPEKITTKELNMSPRGREYGIYDMYSHIDNFLPIEYSYNITKDEEVIKCWKP